MKVGSLKMVMVGVVEEFRAMMDEEEGRRGWCWRWEGVGGKMAKGDPGVRGGKEAERGEKEEKLPWEVGV